MKFSELGLLPELLRAVEDAGYSEPTPIQAQAIPVIMAGRAMGRHRGPPALAPGALESAPSPRDPRRRNPMTRSRIALASLVAGAFVTTTALLGSAAAQPAPPPPAPPAPPPRVSD